MVQITTEGQGESDEQSRASRPSRSRSSGHSYRQDSQECEEVTSAPRHQTPYFEKKDTEWIPITDEDASFILGAGGRTKRKLSRVCGAELNIKEHNESTVLEIKGTTETRERGKLYVGYVMQQRIGAVSLNCEPCDRDDLEIIKVPHECVGYVTGKKGLGLRSIEEEWSTLMFFTDLRSKEPGETENLAIFGQSEWNRRGAKLKVMSAVEQKKQGYFTESVTEHISSVEGFDVDTVPIAEEDYSYALGKLGSTRKKLARASGAILEYVGKVAFIGGDINQRGRARDYLKWLCSQRTAYVHVETKGRDDCTVVDVPTTCVAYVTGTKGSVLRGIEDSSSTFIFLDGKKYPKDLSIDKGSHADNERLLIFGHMESARVKAKRQIEDRIDGKLYGRGPRAVSRHSPRRSRSSSSGGRRDYRDRDRRYYRSPPRRSIDYRSRSHSPKFPERHTGYSSSYHRSRHNYMKMPSVGYVSSSRKRHSLSGGCTPSRSRSRGRRGRSPPPAYRSPGGYRSNNAAGRKYC